MRLRSAGRVALALVVGASSVFAFGNCWSLQQVLRGDADGECANVGGGQGGSSKQIHTPEYWLDCGASPTWGCDHCDSHPDTRTQYKLEWDSQGCPGAPARTTAVGKPEGINRGQMTPC